MYKKHVFPFKDTIESKVVIKSTANVIGIYCRKQVS